jgi:mRNA-degrading endonuclease RelE of RelBE toxin-antitoxin system
MQAIDLLAEDPDAGEYDVKRLSNRDAYRLRVGKHRVIFEKHGHRLLIVVLAIRSRGDIYKR